MDDDFQYVVERKPPDPCCFGSKVQRNTDPIGKGLSAFQKRLAPELFPNTGPGYYEWSKHNGAIDRILNKVRTNKGVGPLTSDEPRFKEKIYLRTPSPSRYEVGIKWTSKAQTKAPFGSNVRRFPVRDQKTPGPGTYAKSVRKCRRTRFMANFGHPTMIPAIEVICVNKPSDICIKCNQVCLGDYWHKDYTIYLCHLCWEEEKRGKELYSQKELASFQKIRDCSFAHQHEGTTAAIRLLPPNKINKKLRLENYLDLYIHC